MRKIASYILIITLILGILVPSFTYGQVNLPSVSGPLNPVAQASSTQGDLIRGASQPQIQSQDSCGFICWGILIAVNQLASLIMRLASLLMWLSGTLLDYILIYTIVNFAENISKMDGIQVTWIVIRDLMNLGFVFLLLYQGIRMILGRSNNAKQVIFGIVLASILINFSLFFTKVMIDGSNVLTLGFYNAIVDTSQQEQIQKNLGGFSLESAGGSNQTGISGAYVNSLGVHRFYDKNGLVKIMDTNKQESLLIITLSAIVIFVMVAVIFFAIAIMFLVRYAILIVLLMFSPLAVMGIAIPAVKSMQEQWWKTLMGQVIFAPLYMVMTWVVLTLINSPGFNPLASNGGDWAGLLIKGEVDNIGLIINFVIVIVLTIMTLSISKKYATQGSNKISEWTNKVTTFAGGAVLGGAALLGRQTVGRVGKNMAEDAFLQRSAKEDKGIEGAVSRLALYGARKARSGSFDARAAKIPTNALGDLVEGTIGRTKAGKWAGLNDVNIPSVNVGAPLSKFGNLGQAGTKGFKELSEEKEKRIKDRETTNSKELSETQAKIDMNILKNQILSGANAAVGSPQFGEMEKALSKLSDKQTESLVESNRELLASQNFANAISVKQLEALNKSDQFSDAEKDLLKETRFKEINNAVAVGTAAAISAVGGKIKGLSDSELDMIDPSHLNKEEFVSQMKASQIDTIEKSNKFTTSQKEGLRTARDMPIKRAIAAGNATAIRDIMKKADAKTRIRYMKVDGNPGVPIALDPIVLTTYKPSMLTKMAADMNQGDIDKLRTELEAVLAPAPGATPDKTYKWLMDPDKGLSIFA